jgi:hypothetical protein
MRALRIFLIVVVILGVLFVVVDRVAVHFAEGEAAGKLKTTEDLASTVEVGIKDYDASTGTAGKAIRIEDLKADMKGVAFTGDYSSATARTATGTALVSYSELLKNVTRSPPTSASVSPARSSVSPTAATARSRSPSTSPCPV